MKSFLICGNSSKPMKLNESESTSDRYILQGLFAGPFGVENRNKRIYEVDEYMKHLQYLRDDIKKGEPLLGELDHPEDRFEVKLKEASHRVLDLWYDKATNTIQGKIELLDTPNGKLAKSLVDQGIPLHISSRAAGTVNSDKTVSIQQIYTFDLVCKPGFAGAVLHRVNESNTSNKYSDGVYRFLTESEKSEERNTAMNFGMLNEDVSITDIHAKANLREEARNIVENNNKAMNESNILSPEASRALDMAYEYIRRNFPIIGEAVTNLDPIKFWSIEGSDRGCRFTGYGFIMDPFDIENYVRRLGENAYLAVAKCMIDAMSMDRDYYKEIGREYEGPAMHRLRHDVDMLNNVRTSSITEAEDEDSEKTKKEDEKESDDKKESEEKDDKGVEIISIRVETEDNGVEILGVEAEDGEGDEDEESSEDNDSEDKESDDKEKGDEGNESADEGKAKTPEGKEKEMLLDCKDLKERRENFMDELEQTIQDAKRNVEKRKADESLIIQKHPMSCLLNESNFAGFMGLDDSRKNNVMSYLRDNGISDIESVNENWRNGIDYRPETEVWLKYAPKEYRNLFENASESVKQSIRNTASFILFENQHDVNVFWENTGLVDSEGSRVLNEQFVSLIPKVSEPVNDSLPYGMDFVNAVTEMAIAYN